uniref:Uncharacterized protein n=1 Tax=Vitrella brassicaformis TaxID=1169539 RepID=A0A7S1P308_9ALVE
MTLYQEPAMTPITANVTPTAEKKRSAHAATSAPTVMVIAARTTPRVGIRLKTQYSHGMVNRQLKRRRAEYIGTFKYLRDDSPQKMRREQTKDMPMSCHSRRSVS